MIKTELPPSCPLLTIAIPTWNRADYLKRNLDQLAAEIRGVPSALVEILVSDNCSPDHTQNVVEEARRGGLAVDYIRNLTNQGWAPNFLQCFDKAKGKYVLLLGDDDLLFDGCLAFLIGRLTGRDFGVVCMRPYGFDTDYRREHPGGRGHVKVFADPNRFLVAINRCFTLTSALVLNKDLLRDVDSHEFVSTDLATFHLMLRAALRASENLFVDRYLIACQRQNSFSYEYAKVFVGQLWDIIDAQVRHGLSIDTVRILENNKLLTYYPFYMLDLRISGRGNLEATDELFKRRFGDRDLFKYWLAPIIRWPRPLAIVWGGVATFVGRVVNGDLQRGVMFALSHGRGFLSRFFSRTRA